MLQGSVKTALGALCCELQCFVAKVFRISCSRRKSLHDYIEVFLLPVESLMAATLTKYLIYTSRLCAEQCTRSLTTFVFQPNTCCLLVISPAIYGKIEMQICIFFSPVYTKLYSLNTTFWRHMQAQLSLVCFKLHTLNK